jgi:hypothetical protein
MSEVKLREKDFWNYNPTDPPIIPSSEILQTATKERNLKSSFSKMIFSRIKKFRLPRVQQQFHIGTRADWE